MSSFQRETDTPTDEELAAWEKCGLDLNFHNAQRLIHVLKAVHLRLKIAESDAEFMQHEIQDQAQRAEAAESRLRAVASESDEARVKLLAYETDVSAPYMAGKSFMRGQLEPLLDAERALTARLVEALELILDYGATKERLDYARDALAAVRASHKD